MLIPEAVKELCTIIIKGFMKNPDIAKHKKHESVAIENLQKIINDNPEGVEISLTRFHAWMHKWNVKADQESLAAYELEIAKEEESNGNEPQK